jgi:hypothetical protein
MLTDLEEEGTMILLKPSSGHELTWRNIPEYLNCPILFSLMNKLVYIRLWLGDGIKFVKCASVAGSQDINSEVCFFFVW